MTRVWIIKHLKTGEYFHHSRCTHLDKKDKDSFRVRGVRNSDFVVMPKEGDFANVNTIESCFDFVEELGRGRKPIKNKRYWVDRLTNLNQE